MPQREEHQTRDLWIQLENSYSQGFAPGDTIHGTVNRATRVVAPRARVTLALHGRSKCKITPNTDTSHRSCFCFFNPDATSRVVFDGPLHIERGGTDAVWSFSIAIPRVADLTTLCASSDQKASYVPIHEAGMPLPDSFALRHESGSKVIEAYVEYYLQATLRIYSRKGQWTKSATLPISVQTFHPAPPVADSERRRHLHNNNYTFLSYRLIPGQKSTKLSCSQKLRRFLHTSSVPRLGVEYVVEAPSVIQLDNVPIPFQVRAVPVWSRTSWEARGIPQRIRVESIRLQIMADTAGRAILAGHLRETGACDKVMVETCRRFEVDKVYLELSSGNPALDLGEVMKLGYPSDAGLRPAFTALNISHGNHWLRWDIRVSLAGEKHKILGGHAVRILPPVRHSRLAIRSQEGPVSGCQWREHGTRPPREEEAPPRYDFNEELQEGSDKNTGIGKGL